MQASSSRSALSVLSSAHLASPAVRALVPDAHRGEHHQPPPEAVHQSELSIATRWPITAQYYLSGKLQRLSESRSAK